ncbi:unnamed protein product [Prorocentrum cordatum]|uniref:Uncharacterized protein n=1 Tax=Prorocentrum cordatum TaxID=2364126 RepID=A0ABN9XJG4_9DINO|nr:unnamed protein product [Polarella glacialis]
MWPAAFPCDIGFSDSNQKDLSLEDAPDGTALLRPPHAAAAPGAAPLEISAHGPSRGPTLAGFQELRSAAVTRTCNGASPPGDASAASAPLRSAPLRCAAAGTQAAAIPAAAAGESPAQNASAAAVTSASAAAVNSTALASTTSAAVHLAPSTTSTALTTSTSTSTSTSVSTREQGTLFCWALMLPSGYERGLMEALAAKDVSIFACDNYAVYSDGKFELRGGDKSKRIETEDVGDLTVEYGGPYNNALNSPAPSLSTHSYQTCRQTGRFTLERDSCRTSWSRGGSVIAPSVAVRRASKLHCFAMFSEETTGVIGMIDLLIKDLDKEMTEAEAQEENDQKEYEEMMKDSADKRAAASKHITAKRSAKASMEADLQMAKEQHVSTGKELMATAKFISSLHAECDWLMKYSDVRKEARASELDALKNAKAVLSGADFSLVQTAKSGLRGR